MEHNCEIKNCFNFAKIEGTIENSNAGAVGGIAGYVGNSRIIASANLGEIVANTKANCVGGITGSNYGTVVEACYNAGNINASGSGTAGIAAYQNREGVTKNCYNIGTVNGGSSVGGIVGDNKVGKVINSYNIKDVAGSRTKIGGAVGYNQENSTVSNCYSLSTLNIELYGQNLGTITDSTTKTESEMKSDEFVELLNTDNDEEVWVKDTKNINKGYPILKWQTE